MSKTFSPWIFLGALSAFVSIALGAIGAHTIAADLDAANPQRAQEAHALLTKARWELAARYQMYHALALLAAGLWAERAPRPKLARAAGWSFAAGTLLFSGSLYVLALTSSVGYGKITPWGGLAFLAGWALLAASAVKQR